MYILLLSRPLQLSEKLATVRSMKTNKNLDQFIPLFPLVSIGIIIILCIAIVASYVHTANMQGTVILPGGVTYTGK